MWKLILINVVIIIIQQVAEYVVNSAGNKLKSKFGVA